jgi:hypothetical protein
LLLLLLLLLLLDAPRVWDGDGAGLGRAVLQSEGLASGVSHAKLLKVLRRRLPGQGGCDGDPERNWVRPEGFDHALGTYKK